jgi:hypothetical protein
VRGPDALPFTSDLADLRRPRQPPRTGEPAAIRRRRTWKAAEQ